MFSTDPLFDNLAMSFGLGLGGQPGEILATCAGITDGDDSGWYDAWSATADRLTAEADRSLAAGHRSATARDTNLRSSLYYAIAYHPLFGAPADPRILSAFQRQSEAFVKAAALLNPPGEPLEIPYEDTTLPGWFFSANTDELPRPLLIATNGYDATLHEMYVAQALPAVQRGWNCLVFDGPVRVEPCSNRAWLSGLIGRTSYPLSSISPCNDPMSIPTGSP